MNNVYNVLFNRGFIEKTTNDSEIEKLLKNEKITCYIGFDPTAPSLHIGSLIPIMALKHMQINGHRSIALLGGGTALIGDPSGKTEMRKMLSFQDIEKNSLNLKKQLSNFLSFEDNKGEVVNNYNWLSSVNYINFLRDIGKHFSVNKMIKAESYKSRLETEEGLNFIEFNYMLLQAYDFYQLYKDNSCLIQMGGSDQWGNIIAGIELIRRKINKSAYGITFPLITTSNGVKMGKTVDGALWLDSDRTNPFEYYQYWVNTEDNYVKKFLLLFTLLPEEEISIVDDLEGKDLNIAKAILAFEATKIAHGIEEATNAYNSSIRLFGKKHISDQIIPSSNIPRSSLIIDKDNIPFDKDNTPFKTIDIQQLNDGIKAIDIIKDYDICKSKNKAKRLIEQGGIYLNNKRIDSIDYVINNNDIDNDSILFRIGKKKYFKIKIK